MREYNLLQDLPESIESKVVGLNIRTIQNKLIAAERGEEFYDGARENGYGGYYNDGRWEPVAQRIIKAYKPNSVLQIGTDKGFLLSELYDISSGLFLRGTEVSEYAWDKTVSNIKTKVSLVDSLAEIPFGEDNFDFIIALGLYSLNLEDIIKVLQQIAIIGRGKSFVKLAAFETQWEEELYRQWSLLGTTFLSKNDWREVLKFVDYTGDYYFTTAKSLHLVPNKHYCPEWDYLEIQPHDSEFEACICFK